MKIVSRNRAMVWGLIASCVCLVFSAAAMRPPGLPASGLESNTETTQRGSKVKNSTFYLVRPDLRKCASPMCGGYFVRQVNSGLTRCANGRPMSECYVASIDWGGLKDAGFNHALESASRTPDNASVVRMSTMVVDIDKLNRSLLRGSIVTRGNRNGRYGILKVSEIWQAADDDKPYGDFYRVRDLGIRCIAAPCLTHQEAKLNAADVRKIAGVDLNEAGADADMMQKAQTAMTSTTGIIVAGGHSTVTGPAGRALTLKASQFYLPTGSSVAMKPCIRTGCSGQICSDHEVISTCEYKPEYECYKKASCERQANGDCGFTKTKELTDCLSRVRNE